MSKKVTITEIKKSHDVKKCSFFLNGNVAYEVDGRTWTKAQLIDAFKLGRV
jgi:ubiquitin